MPSAFRGMAPAKPWKESVLPPAVFGRDNLLPPSFIWFDQIDQ